VILRGLRLLGDLVKFEHTIFALPFAYVGCLMAADGRPTAHQMVWIAAAMVGARTAGMGLNRLVDRHLDARNPRTRDRAIPAGRVSVPAAWAIVAASLVLLVTAAARLNSLALALSPLAVGLLGAYSYLKRVTWMAHLGIGLVLACAPAGGWIGVRGTLDLPPVLLALAVLFWVAGFDVLYGCLDVDFDRREGLHSIPQKFGVPAALGLARVFHVASFGLLVGTGLALDLGGWYFTGVGVAGALLWYEHTLVAPDDLSKMDQAFFTMNGWVSVTLLAFTWLDYALRSFSPGC